MDGLRTWNLNEVSNFEWLSFTITAIGLIVSALGLAAAFGAYVRADKAKTAAEKAETAAKRGVAVFDAVAEVQQMIGNLQQIRTLIPNESWNECANLCNACTLSASRLESQNSLQLTEEHRARISGIKVSASSLEERFNEAFADDTVITNFAFTETQGILTEMMSNCSVLGNGVRSLTNVV